MDETDCSSFKYKSFNISTTKEKINITFEYEISNQSSFKHQISIIRKQNRLRPVSSNLIQRMIFNIGMVTLINYWRLTDCPELIVDCCKLEDEQIKWWESFYSSLLGRTIKVKCTGKNAIALEKIIYDDNDFSGYIVPLENKFSCITLETLNLNRETDFCLVFNNSEIAEKCANLAGFSSNNIIEIIQIQDKKVIDNNSINSSALIAFLAYFLCYLLSKKYIAVSNESSSGNTQKNYCKSFDFENNFRQYADKYLPTPIEFFSFLRPMNKFQVAKSYAKLTKYHKLYEQKNPVAQIPTKLSASIPNGFKLNSSYYLEQNNLIPEQEFILKKFLL